MVALYVCQSGAMIYRVECIRKKPSAEEVVGLVWPKMYIPICIYHGLATPTLLVAS